MIDSFYTEICEHFGKTTGSSQRGTLKACRSCQISHECYIAGQEDFPYYNRTVAVGFSVEKEEEEELDKLVNDLKRYIKTKGKKIKTLQTFDPGLSESGYYKER
jgi:hypothetical protein